MAVGHASCFGGAEREESGCCGALFGSPRKAQGETYSTTQINDAELARELNELSVNERETVFEEIHGVTELPEEAPDFVVECIKRFDHEIAELPKKRRVALDKAIFLKPSIETDVKFKLMFLRAEYYDAFKAARRLTKYFENKQKLFGEDKLVKKITLDDLDKEDMELFQKGGFLILPHKDRSGRPICCADVSRFDFSRDISMVSRPWIYLLLYYSS
jgi:hypothetical protein